MATLNTRIQLKCDTYENWQANDIVLKNGEIGFCVIPADTGAAQTEPTVMAKIGDGTKKYSELDWMSAKAADVYEWAKAATKPTYQASDIEGLEEFISGEVNDTNTQYQIVQNGNMGFKLQKKDIGDPNFTDVNDITLVAPTLGSGSANGTVAYNGTDVAVTGLKDAAYTTVADIIAQVTGPAEPEEPATGADNTIAGAKAYADEKVAALDFTDSAKEHQFITAVNETDGVVSVTRAQPAVADINGLDTALAAKQDTVVFNTAYDASSNKAATMTDVNNAVSGLSGAMHYVGTSTTDPATGTVTIGDAPYTGKVGDVVVYNAKEYVCESVGEGTATWRLLGDEGSYAVKGAITNADIATGAAIDASKVTGLEQAISDIAGLKTSVGETPVAEQITTAIGNLDNSDAAVANQFVTAVTQTDGVVAVQRAQAAVADINGLQTALDAKANDGDLAPVAKSGKVDDLTQDAVLILNCGSATVNV
jgi:hypothetical protein